MNNGSDPSTQALQAEIAQLRVDFAKVTETLKQMAAQRGAEFVGEARETADRLTAEMRRHARDVADTVEERPYATALTTFGIGLILGMLFAGRR